MEIRKLIYMSLLVCGSAYACPKELIGTFSCKTTDQTDIVNIFADSETSLNVDSAQYVFDDIDHPVNDDPTFKNAIEHTSCNENVLRSRLVGDFYAGDSIIGHYDSTTEYFIVNNALVQATTGKMTNSIGETPLDSRITCDRIAEQK